MVSQIKKRDGRIVEFDFEKILDCIWRAAESVGGTDKERAKFLAEVSISYIEDKFGDAIPSVEDISDIVEKVLMDYGHAKTAKSFILYRQKRKEIREAKKLC
jgi:ribonucleoside-triphosphate reductase